VAPVQIYGIAGLGAFENDKPAWLSAVDMTRRTISSSSTNSTVNSLAVLFMPFVAVGFCCALARNMLLIPLAYAVLHLAMRTRAQERMPLWSEMALLFTIWAIINFTAINLFQLFSK
jgi:hypothetical protein